MSQIEIGKSRQTEAQEAEAARILVEQQKAAELAKKATKPKYSPKPAPASLPTYQPPEGIQEYARQLAIERWGEAQVAPLLQLIGKESGGVPGRLNASSYACGIPQALSCTKLYPEMTKAKIAAVKQQVIYNGKVMWVLPDADFRHELEWMMGYISGRYGTPAAALAFHHLRGWY